MPKFYIFVTDCFCNVMPYTSYSEKLPGPGCRILFRTLVLTFCLCLLSGFEVRAQSAQRKFVVRGHVTDQTGAPLVGVTVVEHGTSNGVATLSGGEFSISVAPGAVLDVSCVGYVPRSVPTENRTGLDITLEEDVKVIADVIVTALGLERNYADLTYSADKIKGTQLTNVKSSNMILSLAGKSAGVQVNESSSGAGASSKISIRGVRSVASDNQPLYVVDACRFSTPRLSRSIRPSGVSPMRATATAATASRTSMPRTSRASRSSRVLRRPRCTAVRPPTA